MALMLRQEFTDLRNVVCFEVHFGIQSLAGDGFYHAALEIRERLVFVRAQQRQDETGQHKNTYGAYCAEYEFSL